ncbi:unnamed protein product [Lathyrus oleraceus]
MNRRIGRFLPFKSVACSGYCCNEEDAVLKQETNECFNEGCPRLICLHWIMTSKCAYDESSMEVENANMACL